MAGDQLRTSDAVVFLPGFMGSELTDSRGDVVWGMRPSVLLRQIGLGNVLRRLQLDDDASDDGVRASGLLRFPAQLPLLGGLEPYTKLVSELEHVVLHGDALLVFAYDWRRSIATSARSLEQTAVKHLERWRRRWKEIGSPGTEEPRLTLVCHSMGGLVARYAVEVLKAMKGDVRQIVTLGTPFAGSLKAFRILADGRYLPFGLLASQLRDAGRTFPGLYELVARYGCLANGPELRTIEPPDVTAVGASGDRARAAFEMLDRITVAARNAGPSATPVRPLVGLSQPTLQSVAIEAGEASFEEQLAGVDYSGDGTVFRRSAAPPGTTPGYLPQGHGAIAKSREAVTFIYAVLTEQVLGPLQAEPLGIGIRVPDAVRPGEPFEVEIRSGSARASCRIQDAETNRQVAALRVQSREGRLVALGSLAVPGLYRVTAAGSGLSPVEELVAVIDLAADPQSL